MRKGHGDARALVQRARAARSAGLRLLFSSRPQRRDQRLHTDQSTDEAPIPPVARVHVA